MVTPPELMESPCDRPEVHRRDDPALERLYRGSSDAIVRLAGLCARGYKPEVRSGS